MLINTLHLNQYNLHFFYLSLKKKKSQFYPRILNSFIIKILSINQ